MRAACEQRGYALLAALLVTGLAAVFAAAAVAAVGAGLEVAAGDASAAVVSRAAREALDGACADLRRRPDRLPWGVSGQTSWSGVDWSFACVEIPSVEATACVRADVVVLAGTAAARRRLHAVVELRPARGAQGLTVYGDVHVGAPLVVSGGGLYSGGCVSGRESITFVDPLATGPAPPADHVHGADWPVAAVHALGSIWERGMEIHEDPARSGPDTDMHTGAGRVGALTEPPSPAEKTLLLESADVRLDPGPASTVDIAGLAAAAPSGAAALLVAVSDRGSPVTVVGERATGACPLVLVLEGDAVLGADGVPVWLRGALIGLGDVAVEGPLGVEGHLWARSLTVGAHTCVATPAEWRRRPLPGLVDTVIAALGR